MTLEIILVLGIVLFALVLFITEKLPVDITSFLLMVILLILGQIFPESFPSIKESLSGLSNSATITVLAMFILSHGIQKTGLLQQIGRIVFPYVKGSVSRQTLAIGLMVGPISGFINNTASVAILLPMVTDMAKKGKTAATQLLIPLSFFGMLGGTLTLIGTSTNILASSILEDANILDHEIGMFEFTKLGTVVFAVGAIYLLTIGRFLLPKRKDETPEEPETFFLSEIIIQKGFISIGKSYEKSHFTKKTDVELIKIIRGKKSIVQEVEKEILQEGDILRIKGNEQEIINISRIKNVSILRNFDKEERRNSFKSGKIVKILLKNKQFFKDQELDEIDFNQKFNIKIIGINHEKSETKFLKSTGVNVGDILLAHVSLNSLERIKRKDNFVILEEVQDDFSPEKTGIMLTIIAAVVLCSAFAGIPIVITALAGVIAAILFKCVHHKEMYTAVNWEIIFLLAGVIPLGIALQKTGAAEFLAGGITYVAGDVSPLILLMMLYLITTMLTEIISNNAAVVILVPIALSVSAALDLNPFAFSLAVMFAASTSFLSPVGYQTNTMVYAKGNYKFSDFIKVGAPLNIILLFVTCYLISYWWPLQNI